MRKCWLAALALGLVLSSSVTGVMAMQAENTDNAGTKFPSQTLAVRPEKREVKQISGVVYAQVPSRGFASVPLQMDILQPQQKEKMPAIVYVTGGGFINANRDNGVQLRQYLAEKGYVVASINYRVAPTATFPAPLQDVKAAIRYLKAHADQWNIDKDRVGIIGGSAGGYLSAFAGTTSGTKIFDSGDNLNKSSAVRCAVDLYGISDPTRIGMDYSPEVQKLHASAGATEALWVNGSPVFGGRDGGILADKEAAEKANPIHYIGQNSAPMLLMHGTADTVVSPGQTDLLYQALRKNGITAERYLIPGAQHGGIYWVQEPVLRVIGDFFDKYLK